MHSKGAVYSFLFFINADGFNNLQELTHLGLSESVILSIYSVSPHLSTQIGLLSLSVLINLSVHFLVQVVPSVSMKAVGINSLQDDTHRFSLEFVS